MDLGETFLISFAGTPASTSAWYLLSNAFELTKNYHFDPIFCRDFPGYVKFVAA